MTAVVALRRTGAFTQYALLAGYAGWAVHREQPALDLSLARQRVPALSMALCALASIVTWAAVFLLPVFVQSVQGRSALVTGLAMAPQGLIGAATPLWLVALILACRSAAGSLGIGLIASLYATTARARGPVEALHQSGWLIVAISALGAAAALLLPKTRNVALSR